MSTEDIIPVIDEKYSISKKLNTADFIVEKRWVTKTISVPVSVRYEEIFVNGKQFGSGFEHMLSSLKGAIKRESEEEAVRKKKARLKGEQVPLYDGSRLTEERLALFGEEITIQRKTRLVGEAVITKRRVTENKKVSINVKGERVTVRHPDGMEGQIQDKYFAAATS